MAYSCEIYGDAFLKLSDLLEHRRTTKHQKMFACDTCLNVFNRRTTLDRHMKKHLERNKLHCEECGLAFTRKDNLLRHKTIKHVHGNKRKVDNGEES